MYDAYVVDFLWYSEIHLTPQTCKRLYNLTNSRRFWSGLARVLCSKPDVGNVKYQLGDYSGVELMQWTLRRLRTQDQWASEYLSRPLQFRSRLIEGNLLLNRAQLLRGGRWLFTLLYDGTAQIQDLDQVDPQPQFLFRSHLDNEEPLAEFQIWIDETKSDLTFLVATYSFATHGKS